MNSFLAFLQAKGVGVDTKKQDKLK